ncbi:MAG: WD40 repeat domain-containing protein [Candidatus Bipolaricaulota bacterium]
MTPADWTGGAIAVAWTSPADLSGIAAAWYKLGTAPKGPDDGIRAVGNPLTLASPPEGRQTVFVWLEDRAGNKSEVSRAEADVLLDRTPPTGKVVANGGARYVFSTGVTLAVEAEDRARDGPGSGVASLRLSNDSKTWTAWQGFAASLSWDLVRFGGAATPGPKTVFVELRDKAGNLARFTTEVTLVQTLVYPEPILSLAFTAAGDLLAHGSPAGTIRILNLTTGQEVRTLRGHTGGVYSVAFSPNGKLLASGSNDNTVRLWDITTGKEARVLRGHIGGVWSVAFSPDGKTLASGSTAGKIAVWSVTTGKELHALDGHTDQINALAYSPDGQTLASAGNDKEIRLWDLGP